MTKYRRENNYINTYEYVSNNQHGRRYRQSGCQIVKCSAITCQINDRHGMQMLCILSDQLNVPVRYDNGSASITITAWEPLRGLQ